MHTKNGLTSGHDILISTSRGPSLPVSRTVGCTRIPLGNSVLVHNSGFIYESYGTSVAVSRQGAGPDMKKFLAVYAYNPL